MGARCCGGGRKARRKRIFIVGDDAVRQKALKDLLAADLLPTEINTFYDCFCICDRDGDGSVSSNELVRQFGLANSPFTERVFKCLDDGDGRMGFLEFALSIINFVSLPPLQLAKFAFSLYDVDNSMALSQAELATMVNHIYGTSMDGHARVLRLVQAIDVDNDNLISQVRSGIITMMLYYS
jgi:Ca2+-binding EF-hand superfamily protein